MSDFKINLTTFFTTLLVVGCMIFLSSCGEQKMDNKTTLIPINSSLAPQAIGPYSQAIAYDNLIFVSGQIGLNPNTGELISNDIKSQTEQALKNMEHILQEAGSGFDKVVKTTLYLTDISNFDLVNEIYGQSFTSLKPARVTVEVSKLPKNALIEIDCIAVR